MSTVSPATSSKTDTAASAVDSSMKAFRQADFLKIMLTEVTNQSPLDPQDTGKMVDNMQKLQELANTTYTKFRNDVKWAQDMVGQTVSVSQQALTPDEKTKLVNKGLAPDVGYAQKTGVVGGFRVVDEVVYVGINGKDYPIDNIKQVLPKGKDDSYLSQVANQMLGKTVAYADETGAIQSGAVKAVKWGDNGEDISLQIGDKAVDFAKVVQIGL
jgi:flagellar hook assembly protein FlgD